MLYLVLLLLWIVPCDAVIAPPSAYVQGAFVENDAWAAVQPYLLPEDLPIKEQLDAFFSKNRAIESFDSLKRAGFTNTTPRQWTTIVVTTHPLFPGYVFKLSLDEQPYYKNRPEHLWWIDRITGARRIQDLIDEQGLNHLFKTPKKWIYPLPDDPAPAETSLRKNFILVEEDMQILDKDSNEAAWRRVSIELLANIYLIIETVGYQDAKKDNMPFCADGKIAFLDTQKTHVWPVSYNRIARLLTGDELEFWLALANNSRKN